MILPHSPETIDLITDDQWQDGMRLYRDKLLVESDWTQLPDAPVDRQAWSTYRQALRDFPNTWTPGPEVIFPEPPDA